MPPAPSRTRARMALRLVGECALAALLVAGVVELRSSHVPHLPAELWALHSLSDSEFRPQASPVGGPGPYMLRVAATFALHHAPRRSAELRVGDGPGRVAHALSGSRWFHLTTPQPDLWRMQFRPGLRLLYFHDVHARYRQVDANVVTDTAGDAWYLYRRRP